jgi:hypothetical protein
MNRFNEGKACDAIIRHLEAREGRSRMDVRLPEQEGDAAPIELACFIGSQLFAVEHTGLEPFDGQIAIEVKHHLEPLRTTFVGKIPDGELYDLQIPAGATLKLNERKVREIVSVLATWIANEGSRAQLAPPGRKGIPIERVADAVIPFTVRLYRSALPGSPGLFWTTHTVDQLANSRSARIERACRAKYPKLEKWKQRRARTVLIFEENDIQLTKAADVCRSLLEVEKSLQIVVPDEVYLVTTSLLPWRVWFLRVNARSFFDLSDPNERAWEIDPAELLRVTAR